MHLIRSLILSAALALSAPTDLSTAATCRDTTIIQDGGFETGVTPSGSGGPWTVYAFIGATGTSLSSPSTDKNGGKYAFYASLFPGPYSNGQSGATLTQTLTTCAGHNYSITADFEFNSTAGGNCAITLEYPFKTGIGSVTTGSGVPGIVPGVWTTTAATFQAVSAQSVLAFVFNCNSGAEDYVYLDNVKVKPYAGNAY